VDFGSPRDWRRWRAGTGPRQR